MKQRISTRSQCLAPKELVIGVRNYQARKLGTGRQAYVRSVFNSINVVLVDMAAEIKKTQVLDHLPLSEQKQKKLDSLAGLGKVIKSGGVVALLPDDIAFILELYAISVFQDAKLIRMDADCEGLRAAAEIHYRHLSASDPANVKITESDVRLVAHANLWFQQAVRDLYGRGSHELAAHRDGLARAMRCMEDEQLKPPDC